MAQVLEHFENFPRKGAEFNFNNHPMTILEVEDNRVVQVLIDVAVNDDDDEDDEPPIAANTAG